MLSIRLSLACAAMLGLGVESARAQLPFGAPPIGMPYSAPYSWWNVPNYGSMPSYGYPNMRWQYPGGLWTATVNPWAAATMFPQQPTWITATGVYKPYGFDQWIIRPARARETQHPAVSYREMMAYEMRNAALDDGTATFTVRLPANATLIINDKQMTQRGTERIFVTPKLPSKTQFYSFVIRASWRDDLGARTQETTLRARSGRSYTVNFPLPRED
ncbi:MAG: TIGR03000 domain-containing protein [Gemmataceae bacterium]|nr:TIGR03000 domain-containing protein [Gemmataceae bacterium]